MSPFLQRYIGFCKERGIVQAHAAGLQRLWLASWSSLFRKRIKLLMSKNTADKTSITSGDRMSLENVTEKQIPELEAFIWQNNVQPVSAIKRLRYSVAHGYHGFIGRMEGQIICYGWWTDRTRSHPHLWLHGISLQEGEVFTFDLFVSPAFRGKHIPVEFMAKGQEYLEQIGYKRALTSVAQDNRRSVWVHHLFGWKELEQHTVVTLLSLFMITGWRVRLYDSRWF